jgi:hypothetical protein
MSCRTTGLADQSAIRIVHVGLASWWQRLSLGIDSVSGSRWSPSRALDTCTSGLVALTDRVS